VHGSCSSRPPLPNTKELSTLAAPLPPAPWSYRHKLLQASRHGHGAQGSGVHAVLVPHAGLQAGHGLRGDAVGGQGEGRGGSGVRVGVRKRKGKRGGGAIGNSGILWGACQIKQHSARVRVGWGGVGWGGGNGTHGADASGRYKWLGFWEGTTLRQEQV
jgi:hypothetical protein